MTMDERREVLADHSRWSTADDRIRSGNWTSSRHLLLVSVTCIHRPVTETSHAVG